VEVIFLIKEKETTSLNVQIEDDLYIEFKLICIRNKAKIKDGVKKAIELYIKNYKKGES
jgi:hypothetical protein